MSFDTVQVEDSPSDFLSEILDGLLAAEKFINPKWLYDIAGSALFEEITQLPEYYLTRVETQILKDNAVGLASLVSDRGALVEFGSGASVKTRTLLTAGDHFGVYVPIDISESFLRETATGLAQRYPNLTIEPVVGDFLHPVVLPEGLSGTHKVGFFPGSTLGNITRDEAELLLRRARNWPGITAFILGVDLVKEQHVLEAAYDDAQRVTAKFISNVLVRLNRELDGNFDLSRFAYDATWNAAKNQIEMSLVSTCEQTAMIGGWHIDFHAGERIMISKSRKFTPESIRQIAIDSGWSVQTLHTDSDMQFAVAVLTPGRGS